MSKKYSTEEAWDALIEAGVSEETLQIVTAINGYTVGTLEDVLFASQGYRSFDQWLGDEEDEEDDDTEDEDGE